MYFLRENIPNYTMLIRIAGSQRVLRHGVGTERQITNVRGELFLAVRRPQYGACATQVQVKTRQV